MLIAMKEKLAVTQQYSGGMQHPTFINGETIRQKINKQTQILSDTLGQADLIDTFRAFYPKVAEYMIFSSAHGIFFRIDHKQGYKLNLSKFKKAIISSIFFNHNTTRLGINYKKKTFVL